MPYRADLEGRREWTPDERPQPEDWWWDQDGVLVTMLPGTAGLARLAGWQVSGPKEAPTVTPSILRWYESPCAADGSELPKGQVRKVTVWHGFLTAGQWKPCSDSPDYKGS